MLCTWRVAIYRYTRSIFQKIIITTFISNCDLTQGILILLLFAVVCLLVTSAQSEAIAAVENGDANVDELINSDLDGEASRRRRMRQYRPNRRRSGYFPRWLFG